MGRYTVKETVWTVNPTLKSSLGSFPRLPTIFKRRVAPRKYSPNPNRTLDGRELHSVQQVQGYVV
jgi:hypothetical protein